MRAYVLAQQQLTTLTLTLTPTPTQTLTLTLTLLLTSRSSSSPRLLHALADVMPVCRVPCERRERAERAMLATDAGAAMNWPPAWLGRGRG